MYGVFNSYSIESGTESANFPRFSLFSFDWIKLKTFQTRPDALKTLKHFVYFLICFVSAFFSWEKCAHEQKVNQMAGDVAGPNRTLLCINQCREADKNR